VARLLALLVLLTTSHAAFTEEGEVLDLAEAIRSGAAQVALRYRFEHVDQDGFSEDAQASTARLRLNYGTGAWRNWQAFGEFDYIGTVFLDDYDSGGGTSPGRARYPLIADPDGADLNQLYVDYRPSDNWRWRLGRQRILLDDHRFVGNVGWRQNEQTFDALSVQGGPWANTEFFYGYVANANRIFGDTVAAGDHRMNTHLLNARIAVSEQVLVTPYTYLIDNDDDPASSTSTFGVRLAGTRSIADQSMSYIAELATQSDAADSPASFDAAYVHVDAEWTIPNGMSVAVGFESLGGDQASPGAAFRAPLATLHAFQGWADQFSTTPDAGIEDLYGRLSYKLSQWQLQAVWHEFSAQSGGADYGRELDLSASRKLGERYALLIKSAHFDAEQAPFVDTSKFWIMLTADY